MKKLLTVFLVCCMTVVGFASCGGPRPSDNSSDDANYEANIDMTDEDYNQTAKLTIGVTADPYESELVNALGKGVQSDFSQRNGGTRAYFGNGLRKRRDRKMAGEEYARHFLYERKRIFPFYFEQAVFERGAVYQSGDGSLYARR